MDTNHLLREEINAGLQRTGLDATTVSRQIGRSKDFVRDFLSGRKRSIAQDAAAQIREILGGSQESEAPQQQALPQTQGYRPPPEFLGPRDLKVFASAECGSGEMQVFSTEPYEIIPRAWYVERDPEAFGVLLTGESMEPMYEAGQIAIVSPRAPLVKGKQALFMAEPNGGDFRATLKRYKGQNSQHWLAKQFNPEGDLELDRSIWRRALRVLGVFDG